MRLRSLLWLMALVCVPAMAETAYVSDQLVITVRAAPQGRAEILTHLRTGDSVEILERPGGSDFVRVTTSSGQEGWALAQYLMTTPAARSRVDAAESRANSVEAQLTQASSRIKELEGALATATSELDQATRQVGQQSQRLNEISNAAANALALRDQNAALVQQLEDSEAERLLLAQENAAFEGNVQRDWFLAGAGVLGGGMLIGWLLSRRRRRWEW